MTESLYEILPLEVQGGVYMIDLSIFMVLGILFLAKKVMKPKGDQVYCVIAAIHMSLSAGLVGILIILHYIFSTVFSG